VRDRTNIKKIVCLLFYFLQLKWVTV